MMKKLLTCAFTIGLHASALAGFTEGLAAYKAGNFSEALRNWRPLADQGDASAQFNLGLSYENGQGVSADDGLALDWYLKSAQQGNADAQNNAGNLYYEGRGAPQDYERAAAWYRKAAEQGNANAQFNLGYLYETGRGVEQSHAQAWHWYQEAAVQGLVGARLRLDHEAAPGCVRASAQSRFAVQAGAHSEPGPSPGASADGDAVCPDARGVLDVARPTTEAPSSAVVATTRRVVVTPLF